MSKHQAVMDDYRAAYERANGRPIIIQDIGSGWLMIDTKESFRPSKVREMTAVLQNRPAFSRPTRQGG